MLLTWCRFSLCSLGPDRLKTYADGKGVEKSLTGLLTEFIIHSIDKDDLLVLEDGNLFVVESEPSLNFDVGYYDSS